MVIRELRLRDYPYKSRRGLAERLVRKYLEKKGYDVFRGYSILGKECSAYYDEYENVRKKYDRLEVILLNRLGLRLYELRELLDSGIPDYFASKADDVFFVEVKLEHEQIKGHQLECMQLLEKFGFKVVVLRIKKKVYRPNTNVNLDSGERKVMVRQKRFRQAHCKGKIVF